MEWINSMKDQYVFKMWRITMHIERFMKRKVISVRETDTLHTAASLYFEYHIGTLPVVNGEGVMIGLLLIRDLLSLAMPDFIHLIEDFDYIHNFGVFEDRKVSPEILDRPVGEVMEPPVYVEIDSGLMSTAAILNKENLSDIPVVDHNGKLVGIASRVDIGVALLKKWKIVKGE